MVFKNVRNQKAAASLSSIFLGLIVAFIFIFSFFYFFIDGLQQEGGQLDTKYNQSFTQLEESQERLNSTVLSIKTGVLGIEAEGEETQTFWNSFRGLGAILLFPIDLVNVGYNSAAAMAASLDFIPLWIMGLFLLVIIVIVGLAVVAAMTGGNTNI